MVDIAVSSPAPQTRGAGEPITFSQTGSAGGITPIVLLNAALNIVTLSLWRFWGRTHVRRYLWSTTQINGDGLEYTGTGWELFRAFLVVMVVIFLPITLAIVAAQLLLPPVVLVAVLGIGYIPLLIFIYWLLGMAVWLARRYRLSRTRWRGIRFGMSGSANEYAWALIGYGLLTSITLGWYGPAMEMRLFRRLWRDTYFGDRRFKITHVDEGLAGPLYPSFALAWLGGVVGYAVFLGMVFAAVDPASGEIPDATDPTYLLMVYGGLLAFLVIVTVFSLLYFAALWRRQAQVVGLEDLSFSLKTSAPGLLWLYLGNFLIVVFTLGFGMPYTQLRTFSYVFKRLSAEGDVDLEAVRQNADKGPRAGEGLADFFDIGAV